jgi:2-succinyl-6-hydroxy-2,4-cyclohexadiene-1-carboxylate synthase
MIGERVTVGEQRLLLCRTAGGSGRHPLVLLHGFAGTPASWAGVIEHLPGESLIAVPALPGHDRRADDVPADFEAVLARLDGALVQLHPGPWRLGGYSMGARVALGLLVQRPSRFAIATLIGLNPGLSSENERRERAVWEHGWARVLREEGMDGFLHKWEAQPLFASQRQLPEAQRTALRAVRRSHDPEGLARALEVLGLAAMPNYWPALGEIKVPVRLVVGESDAKFRFLADQAVGRLANARLHIVPGVGHNVPLEAPAATAALLA